MIKDFLKFLQNYGVIGLAIAVIIGGKLNELVGSLVNDVLMPIFLKPLLSASGAEHIKELQYEGIFYGKFLGSVIDFMIVALLVYFFSKIILKEKIVAKK